jgi:hypothetical protein
MAADTYTLHRALAASGYTTSAFGKWGMGEYGTSGAPDRHAVDYFYGYTDHRMCHTFCPPFFWKNGVKQSLNQTGVLGHARQPEGEVKAEAYRGQKHASEARLRSYPEGSAGVCGDGSQSIQAVLHILLSPRTPRGNATASEMDRRLSH